MKNGFELLTMANTHEDLMKYRENGAIRGNYLGFPQLHQHYSMSLPGCTDFTGFPASGKSEFLLELLLTTSEFYEWKHLIYVPDVGDKNEILDILIHKRTGKSFERRYTNFISEDEVDKNLGWILHHFRILVKSDLKAKMTPYEFWDYAAELNKETQGGIQTATIDSWKDMKHGVGLEGESFGRDDKYLEDVLSYRNAMAEKHKMHFNVVIHPLKTEADKDGKRKPPTPYDLKGGSEWYNSGKCMITVHRTSGHDNEVSIMITKAKPKSVAKVGNVTMYYDRAISKFYWINESNEKVFAVQNYIEPKAMSIQDDDEDELPF